jgi:hypothetical protein
MGKQFNFQDMNAGLLLHPELGIGADAIIPEKRVIASSLNKQVIRRQLLKESLGEELRVLYVAMTRAKEKLILTGTVGKLEKQMLSLSRFLDEEEELLPLGTRMKAKNYWAFVLPALVRHRAMSELLWEYGILMKKQPGIYDDISEFVIKKITVRQMTEKAVLIQAGNQMQEEYLKNWDENKVYDETVKEEIEKRFSFVYPYKYLEDIPVKVSVSDLKKRSWHDESELEENISVSAEEQEEEQEADDLYMTDMPESGQMEEDWLYMQQLYPNTARKLVYYIEDAADRLEYENSMMFDNYPDRIAVEQVVKEIIAVIQENDPALITMPEDTAESDRKGDQTWDSCMEEMIQIMLLGEMHHRRWRYQQMNRRNY